MKPFNFDAFVAGKHAVTRCGDGVRFLKFDESNPISPMVVELYDEYSSIIRNYQIDGTINGGQDSFDLFMGVLA